MDEEGMGGSPATVNLVANVAYGYRSKKVPTRF